MNFVHVTHEAVEKIGGIGTVIAGLVTTRHYSEKVNRTVLVGPLLNNDNPGEGRLGHDGTVLYSSLDGIDRNGHGQIFRAIEASYDVKIIYGKRVFDDPYGAVKAETEVLLVDVFHFNTERLNLFKGELFSKFKVPSGDFEKVWEYEQYVRLAEPAFDALKAIGIDPHGDEQVIYIAHEYMGVPLALKAVLDGGYNCRTAFHAHEVASVRPLVELNEGHDTMFYNVMRHMLRDNMVLENVFPSVKQNFKHPLVRAARYLDNIFAVGDYVRDEMMLLDPHFRTTPIDLVYNGIPARSIDLDTKRANKGRMATYAQNLFGDRPDWILSHVARPVLSKAIWRDLAVLHAMDPLLEQRGEKAVYFMLGSLGGQRRTRDIVQMERVYGWPVHHEVGYPDLCGGEEDLNELFENFNRNHQNVRAVFVNQFGWTRALCGRRMPEDMSFEDIRQGVDVEFGMSIYEPFGISQLEPLSFGAICVPTNVCGCMGFVSNITDGRPVDNVLEADFTSLESPVSLEEAMRIDAGRRNPVEVRHAGEIAAELMDRLPRTDERMAELMKTGADLAARMSWECVVEKFLLPALARSAEADMLSAK